MNKQNVFLEKVEITNFLSLRQVILPFKKLTVLVGPNASGKSNSLRALEFLKRMMRAENPPNLENIQNLMWAGQAEYINFKLSTKVNKIDTLYNIQLEAQNECVITEQLDVDSTRVISVQNGAGIVCDEDGRQTTEYRPAKPQLALKSAGDYGHKPVTKILTEFIRGWEFYNFEPDDMRRGNIFTILYGSPERKKFLQKDLKLNDDGSTLQDILLLWAKNDPDRFDAVNQALESSTRIGIEPHEDDKDIQLYLHEGYPNSIPLRKSSDGTIRLLAYYTLLNMPEIPKLIAIEEPERNLHPSALKEIATVLEQLANHTQVIITTHSSQLLDAFTPAKLNDDLEILLLRNISGNGTEIVSLNEAFQKRDSLSGWVDDFGIGSAIFDSGLIKG